MNIEFHSGDAPFGASLNMKMVALQRQFFQLVLQLVGIDSQVDQGPDEHVAADAAKNIQVQCLRAHIMFGWRPPHGQGLARALIWLAA